jgi:lactate dehydrogenase-like 2-hydroxyacid dehydrogenase
MLNDVIDVGLLDASPSLRVISQMAVGVDNIDLDECSRRGIAVGHTPGVLTETVADTAFALLSAVVRRLPEGSEEVRAGMWGPWSPFHLNGGDLYGTTLGIVGMGRIGQAIARRAKGFDMSVVYSSPTKVDSVDAKRLELGPLLAVSDNVVVCAALTDTTRALIGEQEFGLMKRSAFLINVSRGPIVDTDALVAALGDGEIAGVGLDVTDPEPLPPDHPLLVYSNCLVVPHIGSASVKTRRRMAGLAVQNLIAGLEGTSMPARYPVAG